MGVVDYDIQKINPNARILISIPGVKGVEGIVTGNLAFGISNNFNTPLESQSQQSLSETLGGAQAAASNLAQLLGYKGLGLKPFTLTTVQQSVKTWTGNSLPVFNVPMKFIATKDTDDVRKIHAKLLSTVGSSFESFGLSANISPPLGYLPAGMTAQGTIAVSIGTWFQATKQVMLNVEFTYSKEVIANGSPLFCEGTISFTPFRIISLKELKGYLRQ